MTKAGVTGGTGEGTRRETFKGHAALLLFALIISVSFSAGKVVAPMIDPAALTSLRFLIAVLAMGAFLIATRTRKVMVEAPARFLLLGAVLGVYFVTMFEALRLTDPVSLAAVFTMTPLMTAVLSRFTLGQRTSPVLATSLVLAAGGALWVIFQADFGALLALEIGRGEFLYLIGCLGHAIYTALIKRVSRQESGTVFTFWVLIGGLLVTTMWGLTAILETDWIALPTEVWLMAAYLGVMASAGTFFLTRYAAERLPAAKVMAYSYLIPSLVLLEEGLAGKGWTTAPVLFGVFITAVAMLLLVWSKDA